MSSHGLKPYGWMLSGCVWFTAMSLMAGSLGRAGCPWQVVAAARSGLACLFAVGIAFATGSKLVYLGPRVLWIRSVAGSCSMLGTFYALTHMPASDVLTVTNVFPVWVALLSWPLVGERPSPGVWAAVGCAVVGVGVALQPGVSSSVELLPVGCAFFASFFTAVAMLGLNRLHGVASLAVVAHFSAVSTVFALVGMVVFTYTPGPTELADWPTPITLFGVGATATVGQICLTRAFRTGSATKVSVAGLSQVVMVMAAEGALGLKHFTEWNLLGTLLVIGPTAWLMARDRKTPPKVDEPPVEEVAIE